MPVNDPVSPVYQYAGAHRVYSAIGGANAIDLLVDKISSKTAVTGNNILLFSNLVAGQELRLGSVAAPVRIMGALNVDGAETVTGNAQFDGNTTIGDIGGGDTLTVHATALFNNNVTLGESTTGGDVITFLGKNTLPATVVFTDAQINSPMTFATGSSSKLITTSSASNGLTIKPVANGALDVGTQGTGLTTISSGSTGIDITGAGQIDMTTSAGAINIQPAAAANLNLTTTTSGVLALSSGAGGMTLGAGAGGILATATAGTIGLTTTGANAITLTSGSVPAAIVTTAANRVLTLTSTAASATIHTGTADPPVQAASNGDFYLSTGGAPYYRSAGAWVQVGSATGFTSLQNAYVTGDTITMAVSKPLLFKTNETGGTESNFIVEQSGGDDYLVADAVADKLVLGSANIASQSLNTIAFTGTNRILTSASAAMTVSTTTSGLLTVDGAGGVTVASNNSAFTVNAGSGAVDVNSTGAVTIDGSTIGLTASITNDITLTTSGAGGDINLTTATTGSINVGAAGARGPIAINASTLTASGGTTVTVSGSGLMQLDSTGAGVSIGAAGTSDFTTTTGNLELVASAASATISLRAGSAEIMSLSTYTATPEAAITATPGSVTLVETAGNVGQLWLKTSGVSNTGWLRVATTADIPAAATLQSAYEALNTILTNATDGALAFTTGADTPIDFTLTNGDFLVTTGASAAGDIQFDCGAGNFVFCTSPLVATPSVTLGATTTVHVNMSGHVLSDINFVASGAARALTMGGSSALQVNQTGTGAITLTATGAAVNLTGAATSTHTTSVGNLVLQSTDVSGLVQVNASGATAGEFEVNARRVDINPGVNGIQIDAGGASNLTTTAGALTLTSAVAATWSTTAGDLTLQASTSGDNVVVNAGAGDGYVSLTALGATGVVKMEAIADITFDARNCTTPIAINSAADTDFSTDFPAASRNVVGALNYLLTEAGGATADVTVGEAWAIGDALYIKLADGRAWRCDADTELESAFVGFAKTAAVIGDIGTTKAAYVSGECTVQTDLTVATGIDAAPGTVVFLDTAVGAIAKTAPSGSGDTVLKVGIVTVRGTGVGTGKVVIQVGTPTVL